MYGGHTDNLGWGTHSQRGLSATLDSLQADATPEIKLMMREAHKVRELHFHSHATSLIKHLLDVANYMCQETALLIPELRSRVIPAIVLYQGFLLRMNSKLRDGSVVESTAIMEAGRYLENFKFVVSLCRQLSSSKNGTLISNCTVPRLLITNCEITMLSGTAQPTPNAQIEKHNGIMDCNARSLLGIYQMYHNLARCPGTSRDQVALLRIPLLRSRLVPPALLFRRAPSRPGRDTVKYSFQYNLRCLDHFEQETPQLEENHAKMGTISLLRSFAKILNISPRMVPCLINPGQLLGWLGTDEKLLLSELLEYLPAAREGGNFTTPIWNAVAVEVEAIRKEGLKKTGERSRLNGTSVDQGNNTCNLNYISGECKNEVSVGYIINIRVVFHGSTFVVVNNEEVDEE
ncbi:hypothetical protein BJ165DRAFT_1402826 [Panaeolus papilionaceus]|nr:hypothetical protein BJ165DRAFT_1402826 [Panaeolus papilionaceus]